MMGSPVVPLIMAFLIASGASHTDLSSGSTTEEALLWKSTKMEENLTSRSSAKMAFVERNSTGLVENLVTIVDNLTTTVDNLTSAEGEDENGKKEKGAEVPTKDKDKNQDDKQDKNKDEDDKKDKNKDKGKNEDDKKDKNKNKDKNEDDKKDKNKDKNKNDDDKKDKNKNDDDKKDKDMVPDPREVVDYEVKEPGWKHSNWEEGIGSPAGLWKHHMPGHRRIHTKRRFHREADTPTLVISLVLGVAGLLILVLLLSMVFITLAEGREQHLLTEEEEEEEEEESRGDVVCGGSRLWAALKRGWTSVALPLRGFTVNLQERHYIQVI